MNINELPKGDSPVQVSYPHFPSQWQTFLWRNWNLVPTDKLADILQTTNEVLQKAAQDMGLPPAGEIDPMWLTHSYLTLIRNNWHLLNYEQLLQFLDWTPEKLAYTLKEEDFLFGKLGSHKPDCQPVRYEALTAEQEKQTAYLKDVARKFFDPEQMIYTDKPFAFAERFAASNSSGNSDSFDFNIIHAYSASCGDVLGNAQELDPLPENLLSQYASMGIKGIWMHALLHLLSPIPGAEEFSSGAEKRMANLKMLVTRCAEYGIKIYLYLNEPRCMPMPFYDKKPLWAGLPAGQSMTICTTHTPAPLQWLENAMHNLFSEAKGLGGVFCITMSENPTNCHYALQSKECPYCSKHKPEEIIASIICAMERGMHAAAPEAKLIAYDWAWARAAQLSDNFEFKKCVMDLLPKNVYIATVSEWGMLTHVGGVEQYLVDYSISQVGPSEETMRTWRYANKIGLKTVAKIQINNSWELSAVPYIPVPYLVREHLDNLKKAGVNGLLLSWTLGGFPGGNLELINSTPEEIAASKFHPSLADMVCKAWRQFSEAFREFPFNVHVIYNAPMNYGPMNLLHLQNTGYTATMIGFPYDDLETWRGPYPAEVFENQFRILSEKWKQGLETLKEAAEEVAEAEKADFADVCDMAEVSYCHLRSTYLQTAFVRAVNNGGCKACMKAYAEEEIALALRLAEIVRRDSRIGFEASNHYYYTLNDLYEKVISCAYIIERLEA